MSKRYAFTEKNIPFDIQSVKEFNIHPEYTVMTPIRGITEIAKLIGVVTRCNSYICGGYARYCVTPSFNPAAASDIDVFSFDEESHEKAIEEFCDTFCYDDAEQGQKETKYSESFIPSWTEHPELHMVKRIQFIKPSKELVTTGNVMDILQRFDFTVCKAALLSPTTAVVHNGLRMDDQAGILRIPGEIKNPLDAFSRIIKYCKKGYQISPHTMIKVLNAWKLIEDQSKLNAMAELLEFITKNEDSAIWDSEIASFEIQSLTHDVETLRATVEPPSKILSLATPTPAPTKTLSDIYAKSNGKIVVDKYSQEMVKEMSRLPEYPF